MAISDLEGLPRKMDKSQKSNIPILCRKRKKKRKYRENNHDNV